MTLSRIKPSGWAFAELLTSADITALDASHANALDAVGGGTYTLVSPVTLNGAAWTFNGTTTFGGSVAFNGNVTLGNSGADTVTVNATVTFAQSITFNDPVVLNDDVTIGNNSGDPLTVNSTAQFVGPASFDDDLTIGVTSSQALTVNSTTGFTSPVTFSTTALFDQQATFSSGVQLGEVAAHAIVVGGTMTVEADVELIVEGTFRARGDSLLGTSSVDALTVAATSTFSNTVTINALADLNGDVNLGSSSGDGIDVPGTMTLRTRMLFDDDGRVPRRFKSSPSDETLTPSDGNAFLIGPASNYTVDESDGWASGDDIVFMHSGGSSSTVTIDGTPVTISSTQMAYALRTGNSWQIRTWTVTAFSA
jgi:hypothetical protein